MGKPFRMFQLTLTIGADSMEELRNRLDSVLPTIKGIRTTYRGLEVSPASSSLVEMIFSKEMTHDKYIEELERYLQNLPSED